MRRLWLFLLIGFALVAANCGDTTEVTVTRIVETPGPTVTVTSVVEQPGATVTVTSIVTPVTTAPPGPTGGELIVAETTPPVTFDPTQSALIKTWFP